MYILLYIALLYINCLMQPSFYAISLTRLFVSQSLEMSPSLKFNKHNVYWPRRLLCVFFGKTETIARSGELSPTTTDGSWTGNLREAAMDFALAVWALIPSPGSNCAGHRDDPKRTLQTIGGSGDDVVINIDQDDGEEGEEVFVDAQR